MKRTIAVLLALAGALASAAPPSIGGRSGPTVSTNQFLRTDAYVTQAAQTYFVETTGNDVNSCKTLAEACLTPDGALAKIPKDIAHPTNVQLGAGNFPGFTMTGFRVRSTSGAANTSANYLAVTGTLTTPVLSQGPTSGTLTAAAASSGAAFATYTDSTADWAVNELQGYLLDITSGTGSTAQPTAGVIVGNTATVITALAPTAAASSGYAIRTWGSVINSLGSISSTVGPPGAAQTLEFGTAIRIGNVTGGANGNNIFITRLAFANTGVGSTLVQIKASNRINFTTIKADDTGGSAQFGLSMPQGDGMSINGFYCKTQAACLTVNGTNIVSSGVSITRSWFRTNGSSSAISLVGASSLTTSYFSGPNFSAISLGAQGGGAAAQIVGIRIDGAGRGIVVANSTAGGSIGQFGCTSADISNTTVAGIQFDTHMATGSITSVSGTGNAVGISLTSGAHLKVGAGATITGTQEINLDGTAYTLANFRSLPAPVAISNELGTTIYQ